MGGGLQQRQEQTSRRLSKLLGDGSSGDLREQGQSLKRQLTKSKSLSYIGPLQPTFARAPAASDVLYHKGGQDFRCLDSFTCMGPQCQSRSMYRTAPRAAFVRGERFKVYGDNFKESFRGASYSSMGKQALAAKTSGGATSFGTSTRDSAMKQYAIWSVRQN